MTLFIIWISIGIVTLIGSIAEVLSNPVESQEVWDAGFFMGLMVVFAILVCGPTVYFTAGEDL